MLQADFVVLKVLKDEADDAHDFFARPEIEDLGDVLDHVQLEVLEHGHGILVVTEDPEAAADIVSDLSVTLAGLSQKLLKDVKATVSDEDRGQLIQLE